MPACPSGHDSQTSDYCDACGAPIGGASPALPQPAAQTTGGPGAGPATGAAPTTGTSPARPCPACGFPQTGRFCEGCGYDFVAGRGPEASQPGESGAASGQVASGASQTGQGGTRSLIAVVRADREYFDNVIADGGPDAASMTFPPYCPERTFPLAGDQIRIGRRSVSRGLAVEVDLTGPPLDPGVSHLHVLLIRQPDGSWQAVDPGSANGTRINDATEPISVNVPVPVGAGDRIHIGAWTTINLQDGDGQ